jgi:hypothetical protein
VPRPKKPKSRYQNRSWNSTDWKEKQSARVKGKVCQQCGLTERLQVHHLNTDKTCHYALENGHELCSICKKNYKKIGEPSCFSCLSDDLKRNKAQNQ